MMEKRAPTMIDTISLFDHESTFDKMAAHVKEAHNGDVSTKKDSVIDRKSTRLNSSHT